VLQNVVMLNKLFRLLFSLSLFFLLFSCSDSSEQDIYKAYNKDKLRISTSFDKKIIMNNDSISEKSIKNKLELSEKELDSKIKAYSKKNNNEETDSL